jgi:hypothetical protein
MLPPYPFSTAVRQYLQNDFPLFYLCLLRGPKQPVQAVMIVYFIHLVPCSNLDRDTNYPDLRIPFFSSLLSGKR